MVRTPVRPPAIDAVLGGAVPQEDADGGEIPVGVKRCG